jgi:16S rRNA (guanine(1405)-N(7))-methyltransferase
MMAHHASTRERLPILEEFYEAIFSALPPVHSVLDLACGLNPLALPWMSLPENAVYHACDIYYDMLFFAGKFLEMMGVEAQVQACDLAGEFVSRPVDLALVLKTIPCLEQIDKDAGRRLLDMLDAKCIVVSFPVHSLGGKPKGMPQTYEEHFHQLVEGKAWGITRFEFETELAFLIKT